jgi:putative ATP-dependent RNA helicase RhlE
VFSRTKHGADKIAKDLNKQGIPAAAIHGNKSQTARVTALEDFKAGKTRVLVATDIAARGIDISELSHVFNYDLPEVPETYVHRIGRTARAGADGTAVSFCAPEEKEYLAGIEKLNRRQIPVVSGHPWDGVPAPVKAAPPVRGKKPKAEAEQPEKPVKAEKPAKAEKAAKAEKPAAPKKEKAAAKQPSPKNTEPKEGTSMEENQKRTSGGRNENRRSNNSRTRREGNALQPANRGSNAQPKFDPHFVSAPEATPLRPVKKAPAAQPVAKQTAPAQNGQRQRGGQPARAEQRTDRNDPRTEQRAERNSRNTRPAQNSQSQQGSRNNRNAVQSSRPDRPAKSEAPRGRSRNTAPARDEDPGLMLISRRPPQQKFTNFEEYMTAHGGATAPIEDHTDET